MLRALVETSAAVTPAPPPPAAAAENNKKSKEDGDSGGEAGPPAKRVRFAGSSDSRGAAAAPALDPAQEKAPATPAAGGRV